MLLFATTSASTVWHRDVGSVANVAVSPRCCEFAIRREGEGAKGEREKVPVEPPE